MRVHYCFVSTDGQKYYKVRVRALNRVQAVKILKNDYQQAGIKNLIISYGGICEKWKE